MWKSMIGKGPIGIGLIPTSVPRLQLHSPNLGIVKQLLLDGFKGLLSQILVKLLKAKFVSMLVMVANILWPVHLILFAWSPRISLWLLCWIKNIENSFVLIKMGSEMFIQEGWTKSPARVKSKFLCILGTWWWTIRYLV